MNMTSNAFKIATNTFINEKETLQGFRLIISRVLTFSQLLSRRKLMRQQLELCILLSEKCYLFTLRYLMYLVHMTPAES